MSNIPTTREVLLKTHLPQCDSRVKSDFVTCIVNSVRASGDNPRATCSGVSHYLLYDRIMLHELDDVGPRVFNAIQAGWNAAYSTRCKCTVRAISGSQVEVLCPVSTPATIMAALAPELVTEQTPLRLVLQFLVTLTLVVVLALIIHQNFLTVYENWFTQQAGWVKCFFLPIYGIGYLTHGLLP